jgi:hypothetical protein
MKENKPSVFGIPPSSGEEKKEGKNDETTMTTIRKVLHRKKAICPDILIQMQNIMIMKKFFLMMWFWGAFLTACFAQDVIITKDAKKIYAKITEVNVHDIKFKRFNYPDGPTYTILKSRIVSILYQDGTVEIVEEENTESDLIENDEVDYRTTSALRNRRRGSIRDDSALYSRYRSGRRTKTWGTIFTITGAVVGGSMFVDGIVTGNEKFVKVGIGVLSVGMLLGLPLSAVGSTTKSNALREYERKYSETGYFSDTSPDTSPPSYLQFNLHKNGVGLAFVF